MKKIYFLLVCIALLALPTSIQAKSFRESMPFVETDVAPSDSSALSKLSSLAKKVKEKEEEKGTKTSKKASSKSSDLTTEDTEDEATTEAGSSKSSGLSKLLGGVASTATSKSTVSNVIGDVIGLNKLKAKNLYGTWNYLEPGVAFASESLLAEAGGEVAATACREQLESAYEKVGITAENTSFTFNEDGSFDAKIVGKDIKGTYTFDEDNQAITLKVLIISLKGHTKRNASGMSLMFESDKILTLLETICKVSGSKALGAVGSLSSNYDGVLVGFDLSSSKK